MKKSHKKIKTFMVFVFLAFSLPSQAKIYKWIDKNGTVHYDDKPPRENKSNKQLMDIKEQNNAIQALPSDRLEKRKKLLDAMDEDRKERKDQAAEKKKKKAQLTKRCHNARDSLKSYQRSSYVYDLDKDGNRVVLPSTVRDNVIARLKGQIAENCK